MSDVLIRNVPFPKENEDGVILVEFRDGKARYYNTESEIETAVLPPHGRLVDVYKLRTAIEDDIEATAKNGVSVDGAELWKILNRNLEFSPVVLEANNE